MQEGKPSMRFASTNMQLRGTLTQEDMISLEILKKKYYFDYN